LASVTIAHHPELKVEDVLSVFQKHFGGRYEIRSTPELASGDRPFSIHWDFLMKKSSLVGIRVRLKQEQGSTQLVFAGSATSPLVNFLILLSLGILFLLLFNGPMKEVRRFIETAPEFH
jgi:hypothetical protein